MTTQTERMAEAVGRHITRFTSGGRVDSARVFPSQANGDGWMEWIIQYEFVDGGKLTVGAILRNLDQEVVEFHS